MASTPGSIQTIKGDKNGGGSYFQKTVCLFDWWLIKAQNDGVQGMGLAVGGVTSREKQARRVFSSAPIAKRFDVFTLETADGICVTIKGFINKQKTTENGFPSEVFSHFLFGFPPYWEQYVEKFLGGNSTSTCAVSGSSSDSDKLPNHPGRTKSSIPTSVHVDQEETPSDRVSCEDRNDVKVPEQFSSKLTTNVAIDDSKVDDLPKHAAEEETARANIGASDFQSIGRRKHLGGNQKKPLSRCFMNDKITNSSPASEAFESLDGASGVTTQSGGRVDVSEEYPSYSAGRVSRSLPRNLRSKGNEKQKVGSGLNSESNTVDSVPAVSKTLSKSLQNDNRKVGGRNMSRCAGRVSRSLSRNLRSKRKEKQMVRSGLNERNTVDSVPAVSKTLSKSLQNDDRKVGGRSISRPSDYELQEPNDLNVKKQLDFGHLEDDLQHTCNAKLGQNCRNIMAQVGAEGSDSKEENTSRKRTKRKTTFDTEVTPTVKVNKKVSSPESLNLRPSKSVGEGGSDAKEENTSRKKPKRKTTFDTEGTPTVKVNKKVSIASPESLNLRRSRSGRLLVPAMEFWRNQVAIYDLDRTVTGIQQSLPVVTTSSGSRSGSQKSKRQ